MTLARLTPALAVLLAGCGAMSVSEYERLSAEVAARNETRHRAALGALRARGYEPVHDAARTAVLDDVDLERCRTASREGMPDDAEPMAVRVTAPGQPQHLTVSVAPSDACAFFGHQSDALVGALPSGETFRARRVEEGVGFARGPDGELVYLVARVRVVSSETVLVEMTCNEMPSPPPDPLDHAIPARVVPEPAPTRTVSLDLEREELEAECTEVVE